MYFKRNLVNIAVTTALVTTIFILTILLRWNGYQETFSQEVEVDTTWVKQRQALIETSSSAATGNTTNTFQAPRKVIRILIVAYMRGGSTLFGELFNHLSQGSLYWFEPVDAFYAARYGMKPIGVPLSQMNYFVENHHAATYVRRQLQQTPVGQSRRTETDEPLVLPDLVARTLNVDELTELSDILVNTFTCEFHRLPLESFATAFLSRSSSMNSTYTCLKQTRTLDNVTACSKDVLAWCGEIAIPRSKIVFAEQRRCFELIDYFRKRAPSALTDEVIDELNSTLPGAFLDDHVDGHDKNKTVGNRNSQVRSTKTSTTSSSSHSTIGAGTFFNHFRCLDQLNRTSYGTCIKPIETKCRNEASLIALKVIRVRFSDIEQLLKRVPDVHVIHLSRDPRAIVLSSVDAGLAIMQPDRVKYDRDKSRLAESNAAALIAESKYLCRRMSSDLRARRRLQVQYPGAIFAVRYEDLIANPRRTVSEMFRQIGVAEPDEKYYEWLRGIMFGQNDGGAFDVSRTNATATAEMWKHRLSYQQVVEIDRYCQTVLEELGYNS